MVEGTPSGDALPPLPQRATPAGKGARCVAGAGSPRPHRPHPGHTGRATLAARSRGRAAGGGTAPDTRRPSQRWQATSPGDGPPPTPRHAAPTGHAGHGDSVRPPHPHTRAHSTCVADPNSRPNGRAVRGGTAPQTPLTKRATRARRGTRCGAGAGPPHPHRLCPGHVGHGTLAARSRGRAAEGGTAPNIRPPSQCWKAPPPGTPICQPHNEQRTNALAHQPRDIRTPPPALRHSDTTMAEPAAPRKTRPRSPTLDEAHEVIRALGLRDGEGDPPQGDARTDSDLEAVPEPPPGGVRGTCTAGGQRAQPLPRVETGPLHRRRLVPQTAPLARSR